MKDPFRDWRVSVKKSIIILLALAFIFTFVACNPQVPEDDSAINKEITYKYWQWDSSKSEWVQLTDTVTDYTVVTSSTTEWKNKFYVVTSDVEIQDRVQVSWDTKLIICDGAELKVPKGIDISEYESLTVFTNDSGTGKLTIDNCDSGYPGIGSKGNAGSVFIYDCIINVTGGYKSAAIGCGDAEGCNSGVFEIFGGTVTATGGSQGAGIGGGFKNDAEEITIHRGTVIATGTDGGAGIGGGNEGRGGDVVLDGGTVIATGSANTSEYIGMGIGQGAVALASGMISGQKLAHLKVSDDNDNWGYYLGESKQYMKVVEGEL